MPPPKSTTGDAGVLSSTNEFVNTTTQHICFNKTSVIDYPFTIIPHSQLHPNSQLDHVKLLGKAR